MAIERISLRSLITGLLVAVVLITVIHTIVAKYQFRRAALDYRIQSLSRVIEVAAQEVLRQARGRAVALGGSLQQRLILSDAASLGLQLDEPFSKGYVEAGYLDLVQLRLYDPQLHLLAASGPHTVPPLPAMLAAQVRERQGVDRFKAAGGLWHAAHGPYYSVLVPVGGLHLDGHLEIVFNPLFNLRGVGEMIHMPFGIQGAEGEELLPPDGIGTDAARYAAVEYSLRGLDGTTALRLVAYEDVDLLYKDMHRTQIVTSLSFFGLTGALLALALWLLNRHLFQPVHWMIGEMEHTLRDAENTLVTRRGIKEVHVVAAAFNAMTARVREIIGELHRLSALDGLTGIANRRAFNQALEREWLRAKRKQAAVSLLLVDVDYFKQYNDCYGHQAGDDCLRNIANAMSLAVQRPTDLVARYGGEEFVVLLPDTDATGAGRVAEKLQRTMAALAIPHQASATRDIVSMSIGVCTMTPGKGVSSQRLVACADRALYRAKALGRNRIEFTREEDLAAPAAADA
jgi:diguanylate cyclase (GGDEF)-like protein